MATPLLDHIRKLPQSRANLKQLMRERGEPRTQIEAELEDRDYYTAANVFWVPEAARWENLRNQARQPDLGVLIDRALEAIEGDMLERSRKVLDTTEYAYRRGEASLIEFLDAQRAYSEVNQTRNEARAAYERAFAIESEAKGSLVNSAIPFLYARQFDEARRRLESAGGPGVA